MVLSRCGVAPPFGGRALLEQRRSAVLQLLQDEIAHALVVVPVPVVRAALAVDVVVPTAEVGVELGHVRPLLIKFVAKHF